VLEFVKAGGWFMVPILLCSVAAMAIVIERFWSLRRGRIIPEHLVAQVWQWAKAGVLDDKRIQALRNSSPLGKILAAGLVNRTHDRTVMKESIEEVGRHVVHDLGRFLNSLGTIASISPLLGLLGTVSGMINMFSGLSTQGADESKAIASGISEALITTAAGLTVAIPALMFYRYFRGRVEEYVVAMEQEALKMVDVLAGIREGDPQDKGPT
jgi:biopolymer transport protein ExbB